MVCFVPGCKSGNSAKEKVHLLKISKHASDNTRQEWLKNIPKQKDKTFDFKLHQLCHLHFEEPFLIKNFKVLMGSEIVAQEPRKRWKLTDDAIPTKFSNEKVPRYFDKILIQRPPPKPRTSLAANHNEASKTDKFELIKLDQTSSRNEIPIHSFDDIKFAKLPPLWFLYEDDIRNCLMFCKLRKDDKGKVPTFHSEITVEVQRDRSTTILFRDMITQTFFIKTEMDLTAKLFELEKVCTCPGIKNYNMIKDAKDAYRCGGSWVSTGCKQQIINSVVCESCINLRSELQKLSRMQLNKNLSQRLENKVTIQKTKGKTYVRALRRIRNRMGALKSTIKIMQHKFRTTSNSTLQDAINNEANLSAQMRSCLITSANLAKSKSKHGMRYQSDWILQSLLLKICSPKAYRHLRDNNVLPLPHPAHLTKLLRGIPCQFGFNEFIFETLEKELRGKPKRDRQFVLIFDEMKIRETISYDKTNMRFNGYIDYGEFTNEVKPSRSKKLEADHALVFMCRALNSKLIQPIGSFATRGAAPGNVLAKMLVSCITKLEFSGCEVIGVICDGATSNKSAWKSLGISGDRSSFKNKILNPADESRCVYFLCDIPHIIKCIRNHIHRNSTVKFSDKEVRWVFYQALYNEDRKNDVRVAHKLTYQHINPNPFQKMVVSFATQVFSKSVADGLKFYREGLSNSNFQNSEGTEEFTRILNDLFDACNARLPKEGLRKDSRSYKVIREFLSSLSVNDTFASAVTMISLRVTLASILDLVDYLCDSIGFDYVLTAKFNQDCLENLFGLLRSFGGDDCHPTALSFTHLFRLLSIYMPTAKTLKGNVTFSDNYSVVSFVDSLKSYRKSNLVKSTQVKEEIDSHLIKKLVRQEMITLPDSKECDVTSVRSIVYYLTGFLVFKASSFTKCDGCLKSLVGNSEDNINSMLTQIKDFGKLRHPSKFLYNLIYNNVEPKIVKTLDNEKSRLSNCVMTCVISELDIINCVGIGCCADHGFPLVLSLIKYYVTIRMFFYSKNQNKEFLRSNTETKRKLKEAKLS